MRMGSNSVFDYQDNRGQTTVLICTAGRERCRKQNPRSCFEKLVNRGLSLIFTMVELSGQCSRGRERTGDAASAVPGAGR